MIAAVSGVVLLIAMFLKWYSVKVSAAGGGLLGNFSVGESANAWKAFGFIDILLFLCAVIAITAGVLSAMGRNLDLPAPTSTIVAGAGALAFVLVLFRLIVDPVDVPSGIPGGVDISVGRGIGLFLGLVATGGIAYGGWRAMSEMPGAAGSGGPGAGAAAAPPPPPPPPPAGAAGADPVPGSTAGQNPPGIAGDPPPPGGETSPPGVA
jgi:hypothetical protein